MKKVLLIIFVIAIVAFAGYWFLLNRPSGDEQHLIELAKNLDCYAKEQRCLNKDSKLDYNIKIYKDKNWPTIDAAKEKGPDEGWGAEVFGAVAYYYDGQGNITNSKNCLDSIDGDYYLVHFNVETIGGQPDKLAGSGKETDRYVLFDSNQELVCQASTENNWIN